MRGQSLPDTFEAAPDRRYMWATGGIGIGRIGGGGAGGTPTLVGFSTTIGVPVAEHVFVGARSVLVEEFFAWFTPPEKMWELGGLAGVHAQGRREQVTLSSGLVAAKTERLCHCPCGEQLFGTHEKLTVGLPVDLQVTWTPNPHVGVGFHVYTTITRQDNMRGMSVQVTGRISK